MQKAKFYELSEYFLGDKSDNGLSDRNTVDSKYFDKMLCVMVRENNCVFGCVFDAMVESNATFLGDAYTVLGCRLIGERYCLSESWMDKALIVSRIACYDEGANLQHASWQRFSDYVLVVYAQKDPRIEWAYLVAYWAERPYIGMVDPIMLDHPDLAISPTDATDERKIEGPTL
eukprot:scaffold1736_cov127-Cylindrotheca_fusiformis.AAC.55